MPDAFKPAWWDRYMDPQLDPHDLVEAKAASDDAASDEERAWKVRQMARFLMSERLKAARQSGITAENPENPRYLSSGRFEDILVDVLLDAARRCERPDHRCRELLEFQNDYRSTPTEGEGATIDPNAPETMYGPASSLFRGMRRAPRPDVQLMVRLSFSGC
jgi:hypothetical protein